MDYDDTQLTRPSALLILQMVSFIAGLGLLLASAIDRNAYLLLAAGPCLVLSGALTWVGIRITIRGRLGSLMRAALGPSRVMRMQFRAWLWISIGLAVTAWGVHGVWTRGQVEPPFVDGLLVRLER